MGGKSKKTRRDEERASPQIKIIIGSAIGTALYFLIVAIAAAAVLKSGTGSSAYLPIGFASGILSGFAGGFAAVRPIKEKGAVFGALSGLGQALLCSVVLFNVNRAAAGSGMLILSLIIIICSALGGIAAVNAKRKKKY